MFVVNRTDGSSACGIGDQRGPGNNCPHPHRHPGVLIEDIADPANSHVVGEIGPPLEGNPYHLPRAAGVAAGRAADSDELRCSSVIHACVPGTDQQCRSTWRL
jgi:hypothetical protein